MRYRQLMGAVALAAAFAATPALGQVVDYGKYPAFMGQWDRRGPPNNWIPLSGQPPLTPEYQKVWDASKARVKLGEPGNWPSTYCLPEGMPALMNVYNPFEIIIKPDTTYILTSHNNDIYRRIYTDGRDWPADPERTLEGYSIGRWVDEDGGGKYTTLEIETRFLRGPRAYDVNGIPFHKDNLTIIKERWFLDKANRDTIHDDITVIDHALTRPWGKDQKLYRTKNPRPVWLAETCPEDNLWVKIGDEAYYRNIQDGKLMPSRPDQPPPDLSYFKKPAK
jgi:hypothetical protein